MPPPPASGDRPRDNLSQGTNIELLWSEVTHLRENLTLRMDKEEEARELQATEYERRLEVLNNDREEARKKEKEFMQNSEYFIRHDEILKKVESLELWRSSLLGIGFGLTLAGGLLGGVISAFIGHWIK
jgi:hypothetical protein